jgi:hypothetical protein
MEKEQGKGLMHAGNDEPSFEDAWKCNWQKSQAHIQQDP